MMHCWPRVLDMDMAHAYEASQRVSLGREKRHSPKPKANKIRRELKSVELKGVEVFHFLFSSVQAVQWVRIVSVERKSTRGRLGTCILLHYDLRMTGLGMDACGC